MLNCALEMIDGRHLSRLNMYSTNSFNGGQTTGWNRADGHTPAVMYCRRDTERDDAVIQQLDLSSTPQLTEEEEEKNNIVYK